MRKKLNESDARRTLRGGRAPSRAAEPARLGARPPSLLRHNSNRGWVSSKRALVDQFYASVDIGAFTSFIAIIAGALTALGRGLHRAAVDDCGGGMRTLPPGGH